MIDYLCNVNNNIHMKALVMIRVSTETQKVEDQHNEMVRFCNDEGYDELVFVEDKGASAIKLNDQYRLMIDQVKEEIEKDRDIRCFAVWELSRAFRNEGVYYEVKTFLLEHNVQFLCKNPYLKLMNPDGSLNTGMEVAMSLLATLAKQEMELKKERFKRAKDSMWKQGKAIGGVIKYGYKVDSDGYIVINEETAPFVRMVFEMYSTGKYSVRSLYDELTERGYTTTYHIINKMIADRAYIDSPYQPLISRELWDRCEAVRKKNYISIPKGKKYCFGSGVFKCSVCGRSMVAEGTQYRCWHHNKYSAPPHCDNGLTIRVENLDGLLWWVASKEETMYRMKMDADKRTEYEKEVEVLRQKVSATRKKLEFIEEKKSRIQELYMDGMITKEEMKKRLSGTTSDAKVYNDTILRLEEKIEGFLTLLCSSQEDTIELERLKSLYTGVLRESDLKQMNEIVKKHIVKVTSEPMWFGAGRDKRAERENGQLITVETMFSGVKKYVYVARKYKGHKFFFYGTEKPLLSVKPIIREPLGKLHPRAFKKIK